MLAASQGAPCIAEEIVQHPLLVEMPIPEAFQLYISDLYEPGFVNVLLELFKLAFGAKKLGSSDVQFGYLGGIENQCHFLLR